MCVLKLLLNKVNNSLKKKCFAQPHHYLFVLFQFVKDRFAPPRFRSFAVAKVGIKKTSQMVWNVLGMVWELIGKNYFISTFGR